MAAQIRDGHAKANLIAFSFCLYALFLCQTNASLLDSTLIGNELRKFARDALGADEMQIYFNDLQYHKQTIKGEDVTQSLAIKLADKFKTRFEVAKRLKRAVEASYARAGKPWPAKECCKADKSKLKYDARFRSKVDLDNICLKVSGSASPNPTLLDEGVFNEMKQISETYPFIKWQYFGSEEGVMTNFPVYDDKEECSKYDPRYRPFYVETATPEAKDVVLVIDTSASMVGQNKITVAREAANTVLDTMNPKDQVGIVSFNSDVSTPGRNGGKTACYSERLALAIPANIRCLKNYLNGLNPHGKTQYRLAFEKAFSLLKASTSEDSGEPKKRVILFLTDGAPSDGEKPGPIFQTIRDMNLELNNSVIILTFGFGSVDQKTKDILQDIAEQNTAKHDVPANTSVGDITKGIFTFVQEIKTLRSIMATYYNLFASVKQLDRPVISVPYVDAFGTGLLVSITLPCFYKREFIGVTGTDINMEDLTSDISLFNQGHSAYAFMTSRSGRTIVHPLLPAPTSAYGDPVYLDIRALESEPEFNDVFDSMTIGQTGSKTFVSKRFLPRGGKEKEGVTVRTVNSTYFWTQLEGTDFSLGVVVPVSHAKDVLNTMQIPKGYKFKYHRIDLDPPKKPCSQFGLLAARDSTVVTFAPGAFKDPYKYIGTDETKADVDRFNAYMNDQKGEVRNPGLKLGIRDTVIATWKVEDLWLRDKTELTQYLVWRYIGTANGVFRIAPGSVSEKGYDPRQRPWYYTALANTGLVALTTPYLDAEGPDGYGAGVVITAAKSIYLGEPSHQHHTNDDVLGVMGADFPLTYFYGLLTKVYPKCKDRQTYSCFVMDNAGFLIMHEDFLLPSAKAADVEYVHITEREKNIAVHLISKGYLRRKECRNLKEIQKQSFYEVDLPGGHVDVLQSGDICSKYQLSKITGTNAYIGVAVRDSFCAVESCSCSSDGQCSYLSPKCECPCTSPLRFNYCRSQFPNSSLPICPPSAPQIEIPSGPSPPVSGKNCDNRMSGLEKCFDPHCSKRNSSQTCEGIVSCYWCQYNKDDVPLKKSYCASSQVCFRGKEAKEQSNCGVTNKPNIKSPLKDRSWFSQLSAGTAAGFTVGCMVFLAVMVATSVMVTRRCRSNRIPSVVKTGNSVSMEQIIDPNNADLNSRPPAPLPERPMEYIPEEYYEDPDELERQWPSPYEEIRVRPKKPQSNSLQEGGSSNGRPHVIPRPPSLPTSFSRREEPHTGVQVSASKPPQPHGNVPHSPVRPYLSHEVGQPPLPKPRKVSDSGQSQSQLRQMSGFHSSHSPVQKMSSTTPPLFHHDAAQLSTPTTTQSIGEVPPELPGKKMTSLLNSSTSPPSVILGEQERPTASNVWNAAETNRKEPDNGASSSSIGCQRADRPTYCNVPPPLPEPRKDADGYTIPCSDPSTIRTPDDCLTSEELHCYVKCIP